MRRQTTFLSLLFFVLAVPSAHGARSMETGVADDRLLQSSAGPAAVEEWAAAGVDAVRIHARWNLIAPAPKASLPPRGFRPNDPDDPSYDFATLDRSIGLVQDAGLRVVLTVTGPGPVWSSTTPGRKDGRWRPSPAHFKAFAGAVARRYAGRITRYLLWNEPNHSDWLRPQKKGGEPLAPHLYRALANAAVPAMRAADPGTDIVIGSLAPSGSDSKARNANLRPLAFVRALACVSRSLKPLRRRDCRRFRAVRADGVALHPHGIRLSPDKHARSRDDAPLADLSRFTRVLDKLTRKRRLRVTGARRFPLHLTEFGYQTKPPDPFLGVSLRKQSNWLSRGTERAWGNPRVRNLTWYVWRDEPGSTSGWQSGVYRSNGRRKPSLSAFRFPFRASTTRVWGQVRPGTNHTVTIQGRSARGAYRTLRTAATDNYGGFSVRFRVPRSVRYVRAQADAFTSPTVRVR
jgi:hypothetical protein